jgi:hypothetical protein
MAYQRKTVDEFVIQGNYGPLHGWEDVTAEETYREALAQLRAYRENEPQYRHRLVTRRVPLRSSAAAEALCLSRHDLATVGAFPCPECRREAK